MNDSMMVNASKLPTVFHYIYTGTDQVCCLAGGGGGGVQHSETLRRFGHWTARCHQSTFFA